MQILIHPGKANNIIATLAIGDSYYRDWHQFAFPSWQQYCRKHSLGLVVFEVDLLSIDDPYWKKATWQKLLIGSTIAKLMPEVNNVCYLDTDILINPNAPNVFDDHDESTVGLVSVFYRAPYSIEEAQKRLSYYRHHYYSQNYPLDSAAIMTKDDIYEHHGFPVQDDFACAGFFVFNVKAHSEQFNSIFYQYRSDVESLTNGGDQSHFNHEVLSKMKVSWLDYRYQAIWVFEMAWMYPFLYDYGRHDDSLIRRCVESSLFNNYFLHFAGSWHESEMWKMDAIMQDEAVLNLYSQCNNYVNTPITIRPKGTIKPSECEAPLNDSE